MKKRKNDIIVIGEEFKRKKDIVNKWYSEYYDINDIYKKCSDRKKYIYNYYYNLLLNNSDKVIRYGIRSYNSMIINLHAIIEKNNKQYYLLITPRYNYYMDIIVL